MFTHVASIIPPIINSANESDLFRVLSFFVEVSYEFYNLFIVVQKVKYHGNTAISFDCLILFLSQGKTK